MRHADMEELINDIDSAVKLASDVQARCEGKLNFWIHALKSALGCYSSLKSQIPGFSVNLPVQPRALYLYYHSLKCSLSGKESGEGSAGGGDESEAKGSETLTGKVKAIEIETKVRSSRVPRFVLPIPSPSCLSCHYGGWFNRNTCNSLAIALYSSFGVM